MEIYTIEQSCNIPKILLQKQAEIQKCNHKFNNSNQCSFSHKTYNKLGLVRFDGGFRFHSGVHGGVGLISNVICFSGSKVIGIWNKLRLEASSKMRYICPTFTVL